MREPPVSSELPSLLGCRHSPEITSRSSMSFSPSRKSSSMFSICVPAFRRWELHQAVKVCRAKQRPQKDQGTIGDESDHPMDDL